MDREIREYYIAAAPRLGPSMPPSRPTFLGLLNIVGGRFIEDRCIQIASSLTYTTLLALVPILTVTLTVISAFPVFKTWSDHLHSFVMENMVPESVQTIAGYTEQFSENAARLTTVGVVLLGITALVLMFTVDRAFNNIWRVSRPRPLMQRMLVFWTVLTVGPLFVGASVSLTSYLVRQSLGLIN